MHQQTNLAAIAAEAVIGRMSDPFAVFGPHETEDGVVVRSFQPGADKAEIVDESGEIISEMNDVGHGLFIGQLDDNRRYVLRIHWPTGTYETEDPYSFGTLVGDLDLHLLNEGRHWDLGHNFGAHPREIDGVSGVVFSVWAPNARRVSVIGDFNSWDGRRHPMRLRHDAGVWELFIPRLRPGERYQFEIAGADGSVVSKADPMARATEVPPGQCSIVAPVSDFRWSDQDWMAARAANQQPSRPISVYEVHVTSWLRPEGHPHANLDWRRLGERLIPYVAGMGFTHIELMPIMEHPFSGSWGYQPLSQFAPTARMGSPTEFARFVDECHRAGIGVILDWVPAHFPTDAHGLARFDGTPLYEHADPREGFHQDWNTLIYNLGRKEVSGFLLSSALWWLNTFHVDGLRVDAVASMLYRDYSRAHDQWIPNKYGGRENLEAVEFLKRLNALVAERAPGAITLAEESTAWPGVTNDVVDGGLGFDYKWNMGWMHDTLQYASRDPLYRSWHYDELTFGLVYAFSELFMLPISHDEVVHGKGSLLGKMPGDQWRRFANLRAYLSFMWTHPGKKLLFMGSEFGQDREWNHDGEIDWHLLDQHDHAGVQKLVRDLNLLYTSEPSLHVQDARPEGFEWIVGNDHANSVFVWMRKGSKSDPPLVVALNMTPDPKFNYHIGLPAYGWWQEVLNSDSGKYGGSNLGNGGGVGTSDTPMHGQPASASLTLPPLGAVILKPDVW